MDVLDNPQQDLQAMKTHALYLDSRRDELTAKFKTQTQINSNPSMQSDETNNRVLTTLSQLDEINSQLERADRVIKNIQERIEKYKKAN